MWHGWSDGSIIATFSIGYDEGVMKFMASKSRASFDCFSFPEFITTAEAWYSRDRSRPVFPYPVLARYSGKGNHKQADNFVTFEPPRH